MVEIYLHGQLGKEFGTHWSLNLDERSPAGAVRALEALRPGFLNAIERLIPEVEGFHVQANGHDVSEAQLELQGCDAISFTPVLHGADQKGVLTLVAGIALIAVGVVMTVYGVPFGMNVVLMGAAIALGGVARLLMSTPSLNAADKTKQRSSYVFSGTVNTIGEGECVPVLFGELIIGSMVVSAGGEAQDITKGGETSSNTAGVSDATGGGGASPIATNRNTTGDDDS
jgi:predicted phage tail protein